MRRPNELRRRGFAVDRRVAIVAVLVGTVALACSGGASRSSAPTSTVDRRDPAAARDLVQLMRAGERASWLATYDFTRSLTDGRVLRQVTREGRNATLHVVSGGSAMTVQRGDRTYECNLVNEAASCHETPGGPSLPASEVLRVAVSAGAYGVSPLPAKTIAADPAQCFRVAATGSGQLTDLGNETDLCLFADGVPASQRVVRPNGTVDERTARSVKRGVTTAAIDALERSFGPGGPLGYP